MKGRILRGIGAVLLFLSALTGIVLMMSECAEITNQYIISGIGAVLFLVGAVPAIICSKRGDYE